VITAPSGRTFRVKAHVFWDMDEWASGMNISVKAYAEKVSVASGAIRRGGHAPRLPALGGSAAERQSG